MNRQRIVEWLLALVLGSQACAVHAQQTVKYVHTDALGSVVAMTDAAGAVVETTREYEPYGQQLAPAIQDGPGYTGHVQDAATGLTYMQQRYYDPLCGCFLSVDPVTAYDNPVSQFHRYRYANNNPFKYIDADGRQATTIAQESIELEYGSTYFNAQARLNASAIKELPNFILGSLICQCDLNFYALPGSGQTQSVGSPLELILGGRAFARLGAGRALPTTIPSAEQLIGGIAQKHANSGFHQLSRYMSVSEIIAVQGGAKTSKAIMGHAVHRATAAELNLLYPGRFNYNPNRPFDFIDMTTGQALELTTMGQAASHANRSANMVLYTLP